MSIDFRHSFCHSKRVFVRHRLVVVGEKNVVDDNYDENYSSTKLTLIYRPPKYSPAFVEEFTELLSVISSEFDCFAIAGDFNIHIDNAEIKTTKEIITVLNTFDLIQHVNGPTQLWTHSRFTHQ